MVKVLAKLLTLFLAIAFTLEPCVSAYASNLQSHAREASTAGIATPGSEIPNCDHLFRSHNAILRGVEADLDLDSIYEPEANQAGVTQQFDRFAGFPPEITDKFRALYGSALYFTSRDRLNWLCRLLN